MAVWVTSKIVFRTPYGTFWDHSDRFLGVGAGGEGAQGVSWFPDYWPLKKKKKKKKERNCYLVVSPWHSQDVACDRPGDVPHHVIELVQHPRRPLAACAIVGPDNHPAVLWWQSINNNIKSNLLVQFDTNGILTALYIVTTYIQMQYVHIWTYMKQSLICTYEHTWNNHIHTHIHVNT